MFLSDEEREGMLQDGRDPRRRKDFSLADGVYPAMTFEQYLQWLTRMAQLFPQPSRSDFMDYERNLL